MLGLRDSRPDLNTIDSGCAQVGKQFADVIRVGKNQKAARSLRIKQDVLNFGRNRIGNVDILSEKLSIARKTAGTKALAAVFERTRQDWKFSMIDLERDMTRLGNFECVPNQAESCDIRHRINAEF